MSKPYFVWYQRGEWASRCYVEASALSPTTGETVHARVECQYPDDPVAVELCREMAQRRAEYLANQGK